MFKISQLLFLAMGMLMACNVIAHEPAQASLQQQVKDAETGFAATMADRDHDAFMSFLSGEAVFFAGETPLIGKQAVADAWKRFFEQDEAPFSWAPEIVVVLESGTLALSSGPVRDPSGNQIGTFNSIWRLNPDGQWKVIFDKGCGN